MPYDLSAIDRAVASQSAPKRPTAPHEAPDLKYPAMQAQASSWLKGIGVDPGEVVRRYPAPGEQARYLDFLKQKFSGS